MSKGRDQAILMMRSYGYSLQSIGDAHRLSAPRVRAVLLKQTLFLAYLLPPDQRKVILEAPGRTLPYNVRHLLQITEGIRHAVAV